MGARYLINKTGTVGVVGNDDMTITAAAGKSLKVWRINIGGQDTASANQEVSIMRSTVGTTPVAVTPTPKNPAFAAASFTAATGWTTQPTAGVILERLSCNANGGFTPVTYLPGYEIDIPGAGQLSFRRAVGTGKLTYNIEVEEI